MILYFNNRIKANIETVQLTVQASVCLHNFRQLTSSIFYSPSGFADTELSDVSIKEGYRRRIVEIDAGELRNIRKLKGVRQQENGKSLQPVMKSFLNRALTKLNKLK